MVQVTRSLAILSIAALSLAAVLKRDAATVEADLAVLTSQVTALDNAVQAFPLSGGTLAEAMTVHTNAVNVISTLNTAASDEKAVDTFSETEGQAIGTSSRKPAFEVLPGVTAQILQDLNNYLTAGIAFGSTLFNKVPISTPRLPSSGKIPFPRLKFAIDAYSS
ncbi:hydrophobic surface binding protein [Mycena olivaceomarginata]|nr:hydrophobic surface binding protein [Mycena olivaceomarginata]